MLHTVQIADKKNIVLIIYKEKIMSNIGNVSILFLTLIYFTLNDQLGFESYTIF